MIRTMMLALAASVLLAACQSTGSGTTAGGVTETQEQAIARIERAQRESRMAVGP
jgi:outer membrane biogenesis lipoprotein LolB